MPDSAQNIRETAPMTASDNPLATPARRGLLQRMGDHARALKTRKDGAAAVEFALVVPIMLALYFGTLELSQGIEINKKAGRASSLVADLVTQQAVITKGELVAIADLGAASLAPYDRDKPTVDMVGIQITNENVPRALVVWSQRVTNGAGARFLTVGDPITIPAQLMIKNTFLIRASLKVNYYPVTTFVIKTTTNTSKKGIEMGETYHLRPRTSPTISCPDC
jgi:Flp pilus assembly protein TadG